MKKLFYLLVIIVSLGIEVYSQQDVDVSIKQNMYLARFDEAKTLLKNKEYKEAKTILTTLLQEDDIDVVGCDVKSEISNQTGVAYFLLDDLIGAFNVWAGQTIKLREYCDSIDPLRLAQTYYNIGFVYSQFGDYNKSIEYVDNALKIVDSLSADYPNKKYVIWCLSSYFSSRLIGDYNGAEGYIFKAISYFNKYDINDIELKADLFLNTGFNFIDKKKFVLSKKYLDKAQTILLKLKLNKLSVLFRNYGMLYWSMGDYQKSIYWSNKALEYINKTKKINKTTLAKIYGTMGLALSYDNQWDKALSYYFKSLNLKKELKGSNTALSLAYENIAGAYGRKGELDSALYYIEISIDKLHRFSDTKLPPKYMKLKENDFSKLLMVRKLQMKGKFFSRKYQNSEDIKFLIKADRSFEKADSLVFLLRKDIRDTDSKLLLGSSLDTIYKYAIDNVYTLWKLTGEDKYLEKSYKYISENKAVVFSETKEELRSVWKILDPDLRKDYLKVVDDMKSVMYQKQYAALKNDSLAFQTLNAEYLALSKEKEKVMDEIKVNYPNFYNRMYGELRADNIEELQDKLTNDNAILEYYIDGNSLYIYAISETKRYLVKQHFSFDIDSIFNDFGKNLTLFSNSETNLRMSQQVYPILFPNPIRKFLDEQQIKRLIVIRDKSLNKVSFDAIMTGEDFKTDYLVYKYAFSYAFNNKYIWDTSLGEHDKDYEFGGYATNYDKNTLKSITKDVIFWIGTFPPVLKPLKQSVDEVETIAKIFDSRLWIGEDATYDNFVNNAPKSKILHLSLHSLLAAKNNEQNGLIFQKTSSDKRFILKSSDLVSLRLDNSLSVLSSCYSSDGDVIKGEGVNSLARSFALAGSPAIIASQWQSYEGQTKDVLVNFYYYLKKGLSKDVALQKAKQDYLSNATGQFLSPANWANLVLMGDSKMIDFGFDYILAIEIIVFLILFLWIGYALKRRKTPLRIK